MKISHFHVGVSNLVDSVAWFQNIMQIEPIFQNDLMANFSLDSSILVLDKAEYESNVTIAFASDSCDKDFENFVKRGACPLTAPENQFWGVRVAYVKGPGQITMELEQKI